MNYMYSEPITLDDKTIAQIGELIGIQQDVPSPTSVARTGDDKDVIKSKVNELATNFLNETLRLTKIHQEHRYGCCDM